MLTYRPRTNRDNHPMSIEGGGRKLGIGAIVGLVLILPGYFLAWQQYGIAQEESKRRVSAEEGMAKALQSKAEAEAKAASAEEKARNAELLAAGFLQDLQAVRSGQVAAERAAERAAARDEELRRDAAEVARIETLRVRCEAVQKGARQGGLGSIAAHMTDPQVCATYYEEARRRQVYEASRKAQTAGGR